MRITTRDAITKSECHADFHVSMFDVDLLEIYLLHHNHILLDAISSDSKQNHV